MSHTIWAKNGEHIIIAVMAKYFLRLAVAQERNWESTGNQPSKEKGKNSN